jgi:hypothetical protein
VDAAPRSARAARKATDTASEFVKRVKRSSSAAPPFFWPGTLFRGGTEPQPMSTMGATDSGVGQTCPLVPISSRIHFGAAERHERLANPRRYFRLPPLSVVVCSSAREWTKAIATRASLRRDRAPPAPLATGRVASHPARRDSASKRSRRGARTKGTPMVASIRTRRELA